MSAATFLARLQLQSQPLALRPDCLEGLLNHLKGSLILEPPAEPESREVSDRSYNPSWAWQRVGKTAIVPITGAICYRWGYFAEWLGMYDLAWLEENLDEIAADERIDSVILHLDSPGGFTTHVPEAARAIQALHELHGKRVYAYADGCCCSAAYWLAASAQEILATPSSDLGSIGTYIAAVDSSEAWKKEGLELKLFRDGAVKAIGHPGKPWTPEEEAWMQEKLEVSANKFHAHIQARRPQLAAEHRNGGWWEAEDAPRGMVDGLADSLSHLLSLLQIIEEAQRVQF